MVNQMIWLAVLALAVACVTWTITHEEIFREPREWFAERSRVCRTWWERKICYAWTCEYCLSHSVAALFVAIYDFRLLVTDWRGYVLGWLAIVSLANVYMSGYSRLRVEIQNEKAESEQVEARTQTTRMQAAFIGQKKPDGFH